MCCGKTLVKGVVGLTKAAAASVGIHPVPIELLVQRVKACLGDGTGQSKCEHVTFGWLGMYCRHRDCGCWIQTKVRVRSERCPEGKWAEVKEKDEGGRMKDEENAHEGIGTAG